MTTFTGYTTQTGVRMGDFRPIELCVAGYRMPCDEWDNLDDVVRWYVFWRAIRQLKMKMILMGAPVESHIYTSTIDVTALDYNKKDYVITIEGEKYDRTTRS